MNYMITLLLLLFSLSAVAQTFAPPFQGFSRKKPAFITMNDGTEHTVTVKSLKFKKGLIDELKVEQSSSGKKVKLNPEDISHMYIAPSGLAKLDQAMDAMTDVTKMVDGDLDSGHLDDGYMYMESSNVQVKKNKTQYCMVQLMNPTFSGGVKVYNDPWSSESASVGIGGLTVAGGLEKSYYIKQKGEDLARRISKKEYKKEMEEIFTSCDAVVRKYASDPKWNEFEQFIFEISKECN